VQPYYRFAILESQRDREAGIWGRHIFRLRHHAIHSSSTVQKCLFFILSLNSLLYRDFLRFYIHRRSGMLGTRVLPASFSKLGPLCASCSSIRSISAKMSTTSPHRAKNNSREPLVYISPS
jgi:hypothetical protein